MRWHVKISVRWGVSALLRMPLDVTYIISGHYLKPKLLVALVRKSLDQAIWSRKTLPELGSHLLLADTGEKEIVLVFCLPSFSLASSPNLLLWLVLNPTFCGLQQRQKYQQFSRHLPGVQHCLTQMRGRGSWVDNYPILSLSIMGQSLMNYLALILMDFVSYCLANTPISPPHPALSLLFLLLPLVPHVIYSIFPSQGDPWLWLIPWSMNCSLVIVSLMANIHIWVEAFYSYLSGF